MVNSADLLYIRGRRCMVANVTETRQLEGLEPDPEWGWFLPEYRQGEDHFWDRLDRRWIRVDGALPEGGRLYVRWRQTEGGRLVVNGLIVDGATVTADVLRSIPMGRLERLPKYIKEEINLDGLAPLARRKSDSPDEFSDRVATYYRMFSRLTTKPAKAISDHSGVPVTTVRGWIREARLRGKLPPGKKGKAG